MSWYEIGGILHLPQWRDLQRVMRAKDYYYIPFQRLDSNLSFR